MQQIIEFLGGEIFYSIAAVIWNSSVAVVQNLLLVNPRDMAGGEPWAVIANLYPYFYGIAGSLMVLFFVMGYCRENIDLKQPLTMEKTISMLLRLIIANGVMAAVFTYIPIIFSAGISLTELVTGKAYQPLQITEVTEEWSFLGWLVGLFCILVSLASSVILITTVYSRFIKILLIVPLAPIAISTFAGGGTLSHTGTAWVKTFFSYTFEIVVIAIALTLANTLVSGDIIGEGVDLGSGYTRVGLNMILVMVTTVGSVKGAEGVLRRAMNF